MKEAYLDPLKMSVTEFARRIGISRKCASELVNKRAGMSVDMAHRLAKAADTTAESWLMMQVQYALWEAKRAKVPELRCGGREYSNAICACLRITLLSVHQLLVKNIVQFVQFTAEVNINISAKNFGNLDVLGGHRAGRVRAYQHVGHVP